MTAADASLATATTPARAPEGVLRAFIRVAGPYWTSDGGWRPTGMAVLLVLLTVGQLLFVVRLNLWSADLFDALERKSMDRFLEQVGIFALLVVGTMAVNGAHMHVKRAIHLDWRRWLTRRLVGAWMDRGRQYQVGFLAGEHGNPDGRIAEDIRIATESAVDLVHSLFYCLMLLASFVGILWSLSGLLLLPLGAATLAIPGHMVWLALLYAGVGSWLAFAFGRPLVRSTDTRQTAEAEFRFGLGHAHADAEAIALSRGEAEERRRLLALFGPIEAAWNWQTLGLLRLMLLSSAHGTLAAVFPILVTTPRYLAAGITLGGLVQIGQAFQQLTLALSWPVDNFPRIAEWRTSAERILALHDALAEVGRGDGIQVATTDGPALMLHDLRLAQPDGRVLLAGLDAQVLPGERVLISGEPEAALKLFKAVAGVWPWGSGRIELPRSASLLFLPERPYLPVEPLRRVLTWPKPDAEFASAQLAEALGRVGAGHLAARLDETDDWGRVLSPQDQQRLGFARLLLIRPGWIFLEQAASALDPPDELALMQLLCDELPQATVLTVGQHRELEAFHQRVLNLERSDAGTITVHESGAARGPESSARAAMARRRKLFDWLRTGLAYRE